MRPEAGEGLFLLEDGTLLGVRFTGATARAQGRQLTFAAARLEGVDVRGVHGRPRR